MRATCDRQSRLLIVRRHILFLFVVMVLQWYLSRFATITDASNKVGHLGQITGTYTTMSPYGALTRKRGDATLLLRRSIQRNEP